MLAGLRRIVYCTSVGSLVGLKKCMERKPAEECESKILIASRVRGVGFEYERNP